MLQNFSDDRSTWQSRQESYIEESINRSIQQGCGSIGCTPFTGKSRFVLPTAPRLSGIRPEGNAHPLRQPDRRAEPRRGIGTSLRAG